MSTKVFVGMSGGVDSSLSAALLLRQGYDVVGVYMKNWTKDFPGSPCTWKEDYQDAKRVAVRLGIPLEVFDFENEYRHKVVDYMIAEYSAGRTPNPDIMCNQEIKFRLFFDTAIEQGAEYIATGHYARTDQGKLLRAYNHDKDQTYFLYRVTADALRQTLFPLGEFKSKQQVRSLAEEMGLATAQKKDSQGICFVGQVGIKDFLSEYVHTEPGDIVDRSGEIIGRHDGAIFYTIGQRHGLNVGGGLPYYVVGKDMTKNLVIVTNDLQDEGLWHSEINLSDCHWINDAPALDRSYQVRTRHRAPLIQCSVTANSDRYVIHLQDGVRALTPGQSAVLYDNERVVGGGIIT